MGFRRGYDVYKVVEVVAEKPPREVLPENPFEGFGEEIKEEWGSGEAEREAFLAITGALLLEAE